VLRSPGLLRNLQSVSEEGSERSSPHRLCHDQTYVLEAIEQYFVFKRVMEWRLLELRAIGVGGEERGYIDITRTWKTRE
jgi:hypothetical protein